MGKNSWAWDKIVLRPPPLGENPFLDGFTEWMDSPEGQLTDEARETVWPRLDTAQIDAQRGTIGWPGAPPLDIEQAVHHIHENHPHLSTALIEDSLISWLEMEYAPQNYSPKQLDTLEQHIDRWIKKHRRSRRRETD